MSQITLVVEFTVRDGRRDAFTALSERMCAAVERREPGTLRYDWWISAEGDRVLIIEVFRDSDALVTHMRYSGDSADELSAAADVVRLDVLGELTETGREAVDAAATGYLGLLGRIAR